MNAHPFFSGLVKMNFGLVHASCSLPFGPSVKLTSFVLWITPCWRGWNEVGEEKKAKFFWIWAYFRFLLQRSVPLSKPSVTALSVISCKWREGGGGGRTYSIRYRSYWLYSQVVQNINLSYLWCFPWYNWAVHPSQAALIQHVPLVLCHTSACSHISEYWTAPWCPGSFDTDVPGWRLPEDAAQRDVWTNSRPFRLLCRTNKLHSKHGQLKAASSFKEKEYGKYVQRLRQ